MNATFQMKVSKMVETGLSVMSNQSDEKPDGVEDLSAQGGANGTFPGEEVFQLPTFSTAAKVRVAVTVGLFFSSACFNIAVLWTVTQKYQRRPHVRILLLNLAVADLLVTFVVMPLDAAWNVTVQWYAGDLACRLLMFLKLAAMYASAFVTVVISLDRRAAILHPLSVGEAKRRNKAMLCVAWALSLLLALPQMFVFRTVSRLQPVHFIQCATVGSFQAHWQETLYNMFTFGCLFLLPLLIMVFCYSRIFIEISGKMKKACASSKSREVHLRRSHNNIPRVRMRTLKMSMLIVLTFVVCWTPYYLLGLWYWFSPEMLTRELVPPSLSHILFLFGLFNTCLDPLVYSLFTAHFRAESRRACCCAQRKEEAEVASVFTTSFRVSTTSAGPRRQPGRNWKHPVEVAVAESPPGRKLETDQRRMAQSII
ncbi:gonadotropin-releasing hormone II receptor-like [Hemicordylus capensis]|uniref:gonadotropin-releasing hormone II receptor-like n=1 Tax=Hemicordylus capensis TaxID=884348 RepID=UPI002302689B|nr:gonadotropin-releasing hormone II receptor-like [Hemicordylus capensis]XP_053134745.1 gonadotropin-releasing hormone II receptor-like [Hemicordylus capensis]XP_053134746.1 gonadotropin-releasing hormone II receptor-like [Hemicordylus capensis]